jgi:hypothetical protein
MAITSLETYIAPNTISDYECHSGMALNRYMNPARIMYYQAPYQLIYTCYVPIILYVSIHIVYIYLNIYICISTFIYIAYNITIYAFNNQLTISLFVKHIYSRSSKWIQTLFKRTHLSSWTFSTRSLKISRFVNVIYMPFVKYPFEVNTYLIKLCYQNTQCVYKFLFRTTSFYLFYSFWLLIGSL